MVHIDSTKFGEVTVDGKTYYSDVRAWWDGKVEMREGSRTFGMNEFITLLRKKPEMVVLGTGHPGSLKVLPEVGQAAEDQGVEIFAETSSKAIEMFNAFVADKKKVVAVIHVTC